MKYLFCFFIFINLSFAQSYSESDTADAVRMDEVLVKELDLKNALVFKNPESTKGRMKYIPPMWENVGYIAKIELPEEFLNKQLIAMEVFVETMGNNSKCANEFYMRPFLYQNEYVPGKNELLDYSWVYIPKDYKGKYLFNVEPVNVIFNSNEIYVGISSDLPAEQNFTMEGNKLVCSRGIVTYSRTKSESRKIDTYAKNETNFSNLKLRLYFKN